MPEDLYELVNKIINKQVISSIIVILVSFLLYKSIKHIISKGEKKEDKKFLNGKRGKTYINLIKSIIRYVFIIITVLIILKINGVDVGSVLAGVGIAGAILGLAIQDWLKDIIRGSSIISDSYFSVGDIVKYKDIEAKVLAIGLKTTKIQDLATSNIISIANRNIEEIQVVSKFIYVRIPMPYEVSIEKAESTINEIIEMIKTNNNVNNCKYLGVTELADSSIQYLLEVDCNQQFKLQVKRDALRSILLGLANNKINVPYTKIDIHNK